MPEILVNQHALTGEGPAWDAGAQRLYWLDIPRATVFVYNPADQSNRAIDLSARFGNIGTLAPRRAGGLIIAADRKIAFLDLDNGQVEVVLELENEHPGNRFNDGKCDPLGRFVVGSMAINQDGAAHGSLYCIETDLSVRTLRADLFISNGLGWSPDYSQFYLADSGSRAVWAYDYDLAHGQISNQRVAFTLPAGEFVADGMTVDQQGMLWLALWDGAAITRWNPQSGELLETCSFPAKRVTSCVFGGPQRNELYVTSAAIGLDAVDRQRYPYNGALMRLKTSVEGMPTYAFGG